MDKQECLAKLNLLSINTAEEIDIWGKFTPQYTVIFYGNDTQGVGYIFTTHRLNTVYKAYDLLLKNAINTLLQNKTNG